MVVLCYYCAFWHNTTIMGNYFINFQTILSDTSFYCRIDRDLLLTDAANKMKQDMTSCYFWL